MTIEAQFIFDEAEKEILEEAKAILCFISNYMAEKDYLALRTYSKESQEWERKFIDMTVTFLRGLAEADKPPLLLE